jgi:hypothetical protein
VASEVTSLFTDIEGFTATMHRAGMAMVATCDILSTSLASENACKMS